MTEVLCIGKIQGKKGRWNVVKSRKMSDRNSEELQIILESQNEQIEEINNQINILSEVDIPPFMKEYSKKKREQQREECAKSLKEDLEHLSNLIPFPKKYQEEEVPSQNEGFFKKILSKVENLIFEN